MSTESLYRQAWEKWGNLQYVMIIEECAELQKAVTKLLRKGENNRTLTDLAEEIADVEIMIEQLKTVYSISSVIEDFKKEKIKKLREMLR